MTAPRPRKLALKGLYLYSLTDMGVFLNQSATKVSHIIYDLRWTLEARLKAPGARKVVITGSSLYTLSDTGVFLSQVDTWDAVPGGAQLDSITFLLRNALSLQSTPDLDTPQYTILKKTQEYELRRYSSFLIAEVDMPPSSGPASGGHSHPMSNHFTEKMININPMHPADLNSVT